MNTLKSLKITSVLQGIFFLCSVLALIFIGDVAPAFLKIIFYACWINPIGIISFIINLVLYIKEIKDDSGFTLMGNKWIWIFIWPLINGALGLACFFIHIGMF